jgi:hypothetical protein
MALRTQRAWKLSDEAQIDPSQLRGRLAELDAQRQSAEAALTSARGARAQNANAKQDRCSFAELVEELPELWAQATVERQQELAVALGAVVAESPEFGGLYADPSCRGKLAFRPVANVRKADALRTIATRRTLLSVARRARSDIRQVTDCDRSLKYARALRLRKMDR